MPITRPQLTDVVARNLPEFVREDYPTFVAFIEAYYKYIDQNQVDIYSIMDIDSTLDSFVQYFKNELAVNIPYTMVNERFLLTHIKDLYLAKGSEESFRLLFRMLFNKEAIINYPAEQMLRASDGRWNQETSIFCQITLGDANTLVGKTIQVITNTKTIPVIVDRVALSFGNVYEVFIDKNYYGTLATGNQIKYGNSVSGFIVPTTSKITVAQAGTGFVAGQIYDIISPNGTKTSVKIKSVDATGGVTAIDPIAFGFGFVVDFTTTIYPNTTTTTSTRDTFSLSGSNITIGDSVTGFDEFGSVNTYDYSEAFDGTYAGVTVAEFHNDGRSYTTNTAAPTILSIQLGSVAKYQGYYLTNDGFLSDTIFLQDSKYYQAFSYVVQIDERLDTYQTAIKTVLHPAGMALFGAYDLQNKANLTLSVVSE